MSQLLPSPLHGILMPTNARWLWAVIARTFPVDSGFAASDRRPAAFVANACLAATVLVAAAFIATTTFTAAIIAALLVTAWLATSVILATTILTACILRCAVAWATVGNRDFVTAIAIAAHQWAAERWARSAA